jgi:hypothetical protein
MSNNTSTASVTAILIAPFAPAGTIAAFDTTDPLYEFIVDTFGCGIPVGQVVNIPNCGACGIAVKLSE